MEDGSEGLVEDGDLGYEVGGWDGCRERKGNGRGWVDKGAEGNAEQGKEKDGKRDQIHWSRNKLSKRKGKFLEHNLFEKLFPNILIPYPPSNSSQNNNTN